MITKVIPVAAGLAGGSSDAAATLRGLNRLWNLNLSAETLAELGAEIGSDVSFCVYGGTALATGRGEKIKHISTPPHCWVILAKPTIGVSTAEVYRALKLDGIEHPDVQGMIEAIEEKSFQKMCSRLGNVLESVTLDMHPEVAMKAEHADVFMSIIFGYFIHRLHLGDRVISMPQEKMLEHSTALFVKGISAD